MSPDLLQSLQIFTEFVVQAVGEDLAVFAITLILLSVQEPIWDLVLTWVADDGDNLLHLRRTNKNVYPVYTALNQGCDLTQV